MRYFVSGGTGLIGSRVVRDLVRSGEEVVVYDLLPKGNFPEGLLNEEERNRVKMVQGNILDFPRLICTVKENNVEVMIHMAALLGEESSANPPLALKINCEGTVNIFETARLMGVRKVVYASSVAVFGPPERYPGKVILHDAPHYPWKVYGACKSLNENVAVHYFEQFGLDTVGIRYSFVYGAGQARGGSGRKIRELVMNPAVGKPGIVPAGDDTIGWFYVDDAARAAVLASKAHRSRTRAFSTRGDLRPMKEVADYVRKLLPEADITLLPGRIGLSFNLETTPIEKELGFSPQWSMEQGIKEVINVTRRQHGLPQV